MKKGCHIFVIFLKVYAHPNHEKYILAQKPLETFILFFFI